MRGSNSQLVPCREVRVVAAAAFIVVVCCFPSDWFGQLCERPGGRFHRARAQWRTEASPVRGHPATEHAQSDLPGRAHVWPRLHLLAGVAESSLSCGELQSHGNPHHPSATSGDLPHVRQDTATLSGAGTRA